MVEGNSLENCRAGNGTEGSNPSPSAKRIDSIWGLFCLCCTITLMQPGDIVGPAGSPPENKEQVEPTTSPTEIPQAPQSVAPPAQVQNNTETEQPASNWQYSAENTQDQTGEQAVHGTVSWTASEYIAHEKGGSWYILLAFAVIVGAALVYIITKEMISAVVIVIMGVAFGGFAVRKPQELNYVLDANGLTVGNKLYEYGQFKSFTVVEEGAIDSIMLMPLQRFMPPLSVYFDPADEEKITNALSAYLPYEDRKQDPVDRLMRKVRF